MSPAHWRTSRSAKQFAPELTAEGFTAEAASGTRENQIEGIRYSVAENRTASCGRSYATARHPLRWASEGCRAAQSNSLIRQSAAASQDASIVTPQPGPSGTATTPSRTSGSGA